MSELQTIGRSFPKVGAQGPAISAADFWAEIKALVPEADAVLNTVTTHIGEASEVLSDLSSAAQPRLGQGVQPPTSTRRRSKAAGTPDEITRRDDVRYRY